MRKKPYEEPEDFATIMSTRELRDELSEALNRTAFGGEHIIVTHHGKRRAALVSLEDLKLIKKTKENKNATAA
jgi:prevent-host-death family protein